jgi:hypothetical protein
MIVVLAQAFEPRYWYFEVIEVVKKVLFTCIGLLVEPDSVNQMVFLFFVATAVAVALQQFQPYTAPIDSATAVVAAWSVWSLAFYSLVQRADVATTNQWYHVCVLVINSGIVVVLLLAGVSLTRDVIVLHWLKLISSLKEDQRPPSEVIRHMPVMAMMRMMLSARGGEMASLAAATAKVRRSSLSRNVEHTVAEAVSAQRAARLTTASRSSIPA